MKKVLATIIILILSLPCFAQKYWEDSAYQARAKKSSEERKLARAKQDAYWDSINNKGVAEFKASMIKKYGKQKGTAIANGEIKLGDTQEIVTDAWGAADKISYTTTKAGTMQTWYYKKHKALLTFKKNKLVSLTD